MFLFSYKAQTFFWSIIYDTLNIYWIKNCWKILSKLEFGEQLVLLCSVNCYHFCEFLSYFGALIQRKLIVVYAVFIKQKNQPDFKIDYVIT